jgi:hypothetical protein
MPTPFQAPTETRFETVCATYSDRPVSDQAASETLFVNVDGPLAIRLGAPDATNACRSVVPEVDEPTKSTSLPAWAATAAASARQETMGRSAERAMGSVGRGTRGGAAASMPQSAFA